MKIHASVAIENKLKSPTSVVAADKIETCHYYLQVSNTTIHVYLAFQLPQTKFLPLNCEQVDHKNHEITPLNYVYIRVYVQGNTN